MPVVPVAYAIQAAAPAPIDVATSDFRLKPAAPADPTQRCPAPRAGEILVCARRGQGQRLAPLAPPPGVHPGQSLGIDFGGGRLEPHVRQVVMPNGRVSKRIMLEFTMPF
jgi:hypothetical protein